MADLIERRDALNMHFSHGINNDSVLYVPFREVMDNLKALPSAQPDKEALDDAYAHGYTAAESEFRKRMEKPEREKGKWIIEKISGRWFCDQCLSPALKTDDGKENLSDFCPVCGADMRGNHEN